MALGEPAPGAVLFPADDAVLSAVARNRAELSGCFKVACSDWDMVERVISKDLTYRLALDAGIRVPFTGTPASEKEAAEMASAARYPCLIKPCESHRYFAVFGRKMVKVDTPSDLLAAYRAARSAGLRVMVQELIPGGDDCGVNYNAYSAEGEALAEFTATKVRLSPPGFGVPRVVVSQWLPAVAELGRQVLSALHYSGFACTEFKRDLRDGRYVLMEVNARHNRSGMLAVRCGINFPLLEYRHLTRGELPASMPFREGVFWIDDLKDLAHSLRYCPREHYSPFRLLKPYLGPHVYAVWDWKDRAPMWKRLRDRTPFRGGAFRSKGAL